LLCSGAEGEKTLWRLDVDDGYMKIIHKLTNFVLIQTRNNRDILQFTNESHHEECNWIITEKLGEEKAIPLDLNLNLLQIWAGNHTTMAIMNKKYGDRLTDNGQSVFCYDSLGGHDTIWTFNHDGEYFSIVNCHTGRRLAQQIDNENRYYGKDGEGDETLWSFTYIDGYFKIVNKHHRDYITEINSYDSNGHRLVDSTEGDAGDESSWFIIPLTRNHCLF